MLDDSQMAALRNLGITLIPSVLFLYREAFDIKAISRLGALFPNMVDDPAEEPEAQQLQRCSAIDQSPGCSLDGHTRLRSRIKYDHLIIKIKTMKN